MNERLIDVPMHFVETGDADGVAIAAIPFGHTLVGATVAVMTESGGATTVTVDIQKGGSDVTGYAAIDCDGKAGDSVNVLSTHLGGTVAPVAGDADDVYEVDVNLVAGSTPKLAGCVHLWVLADV